MSPEFRLIEQYFARHAHYDESVLLGIGDDCALVKSTLTQAISVDTSIADRHFPADAPAYYIAARALNVSLSDLAAMGAKPRWFSLALSLPEINPPWLEAFSQGLFDAANQAGVQLIGGDTTKSPVLSLTIQVHGDIEQQALLRSGAKIGDSVYISGPLAGAAAGLELYRQGKQVEALFQAYMNPQPQLALGQKLQGLAHSCIDISDGLLADLSHILSASGCAAIIDAQAIKLQAEALAYFDFSRVLQWALTAGDDYQLCFTSALSPEQLKQHGVNAFAIGQIVQGQGYQLRHLPEAFSFNSAGFDHFNETAF